MMSLPKVQSIVNESFGGGPQHPLHSLGRQGFLGAATTFFRRFFTLILPSARFALVAFALNPIIPIPNDYDSICKWNPSCIYIDAPCQDENPFNEPP